MTKSQNRFVEDSSKEYTEEPTTDQGTNRKMTYGAKTSDRNKTHFSDNGMFDHLLDNY